MRRAYRMLGGAVTHAHLDDRCPDSPQRAMLCGRYDACVADRKGINVPDGGSDEVAAAGDATVHPFPSPVAAKRGVGAEASRPWAHALVDDATAEQAWVLGFGAAPFRVPGGGAQRLPQRRLQQTPRSQ